MVTKAVFIPIGFVHFYAFTGNLIEDGSQFPIVTSELTSLSLLWVNSPKKGIVCLPI